MANAFSTEERVFFEQVLEGFNPNNITARQVSKFQPPATEFERSALQVWRPTPFISIAQEGLERADADYKDFTQLSVPSALNANASSPSDIKDVPFTMNAVELNDPIKRRQKSDSAIQALSALVDNDIATKIAQRGTLFVKETSAITTYTQMNKCEVQMLIRDVPIMNPRTVIMNPTDYNGVSANLANRDSTIMGVSLTAFERSKIPMIATFDSFKANFMPTLTAAAGSGYLVNGAQRYVPLATDANGNNVDNRTMTLTVDTGTGTPVAGDKFTIAGVNAVSLIHKNDTGELQTFTVIAQNSATEWEISPPIIVGDGTSAAEDDYANCSAAAADNSPITFLNTVTAPANIFFDNNAVEITHGSLATLELDGSAGVASMRETTDSGIEILFAKSSEINTLGTKYRLIAWFRGNVLIPAMCGVILGDQT